LVGRAAFGVQTPYYTFQISSLGAFLHTRNEA
jgi:hypothetical protein